MSPLAKLIVGFILTYGGVLLASAQAPADTKLIFTLPIPIDSSMIKDYVKIQDDYIKSSGLKRLDVDGFLIFFDNDSVPEVVWHIKYPLNEFDNTRTLQENFFNAILRPDLVVSEEYFHSIAATMPTVLEELKKGTPIFMNTRLRENLPSNLRIVYGRILYIQKTHIITPKAAFDFIPLITEKKEYSLHVNLVNGYGYPTVFTSLK